MGVGVVWVWSNLGPWFIMDLEKIAKHNKPLDAICVNGVIPLC